MEKYCNCSCFQILNKYTVILFNILLYILKHVPHYMRLDIGRGINMEWSMQTVHQMLSNPKGSLK